MGEKERLGAGTESKCLKRSELRDVCLGRLCCPPGSAGQLGRRNLKQSWSGVNIRPRGTAVFWNLPPTSLASSEVRGVRRTGHHLRCQLGLDCLNSHNTRYFREFLFLQAVTVDSLTKLWLEAKAIVLACIMEMLKRTFWAGFSSFTFLRLSQELDAGVWLQTPIVAQLSELGQVLQSLQVSNLLFSC